MVLYQYEDVETGQEVILDLPMGKGGSIGNIFRNRGRRLRRLVSSDAGISVKFNGLFPNYQIPRNSKEAQECDARDYRGTPMYKGRDRARGFATKLKDQGIECTFDG